MAYFDSPKNKAIWDKEIARLETEREKRKNIDLKSEVQESQGKSGEKPEVREITLEELEMIVRRKKGLAPRESEMEIRKRGARVNEGKGHERDNSRQPEISGVV